MKKILGFLGLAIALIVLATPHAYAAEFISGKGDDGNVTLSGSETHRNLYTAGNTVFINSPIQGDIFVAGNTITLESGVEDDVVAAGNNIVLNGEINGDVRVAGGTITINSRVRGDILVAGGTVLLTEKSYVGGDLVAAGGTLTVDGQVSGNAKLGGGTILINNGINGKVEVNADKSLTIGSKAVIPQAIEYKGMREAVVEDGAQIGTINFERIERRAQENHFGKMMAGLFSIIFLIKVVALILFGLLLMKLFPRTSRESVAYVGRSAWMNALIGFLTLIVGPVVVIILAVTFIGFYIAAAAFLAWLILLLFSFVTGSVFVGAWVLKQLSASRTDAMYDWKALVVGVLVVSIVTIIPVIGAIACFALLIVAYGGLIRQVYNHSKAEQAIENGNPIV